MLAIGIYDTDSCVQSKGYDTNNNTDVDNKQEAGIWHTLRVELGNTKRAME